jgi:uncharacterized membrane protein YGL010W
MSKTNWTLVITIVLTVANAVIPFIPTGVQATVTTILLAVAAVFHIDDVKIASASAPKS